MHGGSATQVALVLRGLLGQDVALERLTALDGATRTNAKTLFRAALGLHLGHVNAPFKYVPGAVAESRSRLLASGDLWTGRRPNRPVKPVLVSALFRRQDHDHLPTF